MAAAVRLWAPGPVLAGPASAAEEGFGERLPRLQYVSDDGFVGELTAWLNGVVPGVERWVGEEVVGRSCGGVFRMRWVRGLSLMRGITRWSCSRRRWVRSGLGGSGM